MGRNFIKLPNKKDSNFKFYLFSLFPCSFKSCLFQRNKYPRQTLLFSILFGILSITYLIFFGPEPRYFIGTGLFIVSFISFNISDIRLKLSNNFLYLIIFLALFSLPRLDSYKSFNLSSIPTVPLQTTEYLNIDELWVYPKQGDKCWINLYCTLNKDKIFIDESNFYKSIFKSMSKILEGLFQDLIKLERLKRI